MKTANQIETENQIEIEKLKLQNEKMKKLSTREGFFKSFFESLKSFKTEELAFENVNNLYYELFGQKRYNNYSDYKKAVSYHNNLA